MALQPDGRIVVVGDDVQEGIDFNFAVARFMPDGRLDQSFSGDGRRVFPFVPGDEIDGATDVAILENGKIVLAGYSGGFGNGLDVALARLKPNGAFDNDFSDDGRATSPLSPSTDRISSLAVQADGKLVASGLIDDGGETRFLVARFRAGGSLDTSFDGGFVVTDFPDDVVGEADIANAVGIQRNGRIVAAGYTGNQFGGATEVAIARYLENGTPDDDFDDDGMQTFDFVPAAGDQAQDLAITGRKIVTAGFTASVGPTGNDWQLLRVLPDGSLDESWAGDGSRTTDFGSANDFANAIAVRDGKVVAAGYTGPSDQVVALARYRG
jgi:uncharacterized delta-60 repeat protein